MVGFRLPTSNSRICRMEDWRTMSQISKESLDKLQDLASSISIKFTFWFDEDHFETEEEVLELSTIVN